LSDAAWLSWACKRFKKLGLETLEERLLCWCLELAAVLCCHRGLLLLPEPDVLWLWPVEAEDWGVFAAVQLWLATDSAGKAGDLGVAVLLLSSGILPAGWTGGESRLLGLMMLFAFIEVCSLPADADLLGLCLTGSAVLALSASKLSPNKLADNWLLHALIASWRRLPQLQYDLHVSAKKWQIHRSRKVPL